MTDVSALMICNSAIVRDWAGSHWLNITAQREGVVFDESVESTAATVMCANSNSIPEYEGMSNTIITKRLTGNLTRTCPPNGTSWGPWVGSCKMAQCAATTTVLAPHRDCLWNGHRWQSTTDEAQQVQLWEAPVPLAVALDCCTSITKAGGCASPNGSFGYIQSRCDAEESFEGNWTVEKRHCAPLRDVRFRLDALVTNETKASAMRYFRKLREYVQRAVGPAVLSRNRSTDEEGFLTTVSVAVGPTPWLPVHSDRAQTESGHIAGEWTIDALPRNTSLRGMQHVVSSGRAAAAFARVSCQQHGYRSAPLVTNCFALHQLFMRRLFSASSVKENAAIFRALCPKVSLDDVDFIGGGALRAQCPTWLTVTPDGDNPSTWMPPLITSGWSVGSFNTSWTSEGLTSSVGLTSTLGPVT
jgi:hypothetical protein